MKLYTIGKHTVNIWQSIKELPAARFSDMQKYLIQDAGIGNDMAAVNEHLSKLDVFLSAGKLAEAIQERENLQLNIFYMLAGINIGSYSFACLVAEIDGKPVTDYTEAGLSQIIKDLESWGLKYETVADTLDEVKKKLIAN